MTKPEEVLDLRMYFFVPYNISEIQKGIQAGHAALEYARGFGQTQLFKDFAEHHKTWIILNGGTTNGNPHKYGTLDEIYRSLYDYNVEVEQSEKREDFIQFSLFHEPDLNDALTAICFIADQRVWDCETFLTFEEYLAEHYVDDMSSIKDTKQYNEIRKNWEEIMGKKNIFLRELIKHKKLA